MLLRFRFLIFVIKSKVMKKSGNTILITGGSSGIGLALAGKLAKMGNTVIAVGRSKDKLEKARAAISGLQTITCDLGHPGQLDELVVQVERRFPALNILINNAGLQYNYYWQEEGHLVDKISRELQVNLLAPALLSAQLLPLLARQDAAAIVNVTSALAWVPKEDAPVYCAGKAALHSLTQSLRWQLENTNIKVVELVPPLVDTAMTAGRGKGKIQPAALASLFAGRFFKGDELITTGKIRMLMGMNRIAPGLAARMMRKGG